VDQFRLCEWGVVKRAVDGELCGQRSAKIVALGAAMSKFALVASPHGGIFEPEQLKDTPVAVTIYNGSHFTTLKMLEGFLRKDDIKVTNAGTMHQRLEALRRGELSAATFNEPWISVAQKQGFRIIIESHSTRSEAAGDEMDGPTLAAMFRAEAEAAAMINANHLDTPITSRRKPALMTKRASDLASPICSASSYTVSDSSAPTSGCWGILS
jgi:NitT/TauT family transport system substrate-binding protein